MSLTFIQVPGDTATQALFRAVPSGINSSTCAALRLGRPNRQQRKYDVGSFKFRWDRSHLMGSKRRLLAWFLRRSPVRKDSRPSAFCLRALLRERANACRGRAPEPGSSAEGVLSRGTAGVGARPPSRERPLLFGPAPRGARGAGGPRGASLTALTGETRLPFSRMAPVAGSYRECRSRCVRVVCDWSSCISWGICG